MSVDTNLILFVEMGSRLKNFHKKLKSQKLGFKNYGSPKKLHNGWIQKSLVPPCSVCKCIMQNGKLLLFCDSMPKQSGKISFGKASYKWIL